MLRNAAIAAMTLATALYGADPAAAGDKQLIEQIQVGKIRLDVYLYDASGDATAVHVYVVNPDTRSHRVKYRLRVWDEAHAITPWVKYADVTVLAKATVKKLYSPTDGFIKYDVDQITLVN